MLAVTEPLSSFCSQLPWERWADFILVGKASKAQSFLTNLFVSGMKVNPLDLSPNYAGSLMATTNGIGEEKLNHSRQLQTNVLFYSFNHKVH